MTQFRFAIPDDDAFVLSGWSSSLRATRDVPFIRHSEWARIMKPEIEACYRRPTARTVVAHGDHSLFGFICYEPPSHVHYIYVAQPYRHNGLARDLFAAAHINPDSPFTYACRTKASWELRSKTPSARYDPMRARFAPEEQR